MKSAWLALCLVAVVTVVLLAQARPDEPSIKRAATADPMRGKEPGEVRDDNGLKMKLVWCPPGKFKMGSPKSEKDRSEDEGQVDVTLTQGFWLGKFELTQAEWKQLMGTEPWKGKRYTKEGPDFPATWVDWNDAIGFCRKLTKQERQAGRLPDDWEYMLPTEAQWERGCRAQTETTFSFGDDESKLDDYAWFAANAGAAGENYAHQVGQKKPNPWGLCDMHGNVWEWCRDIYAEVPGGRDPEVKPDEKTRGWGRVFRGGSWFYSSYSCRSAHRYGGLPHNRHCNVGFRPALISVR